MKLRKAVNSSVFRVVLGMLLSITKLSAQDPQFSQYYANPIYTNPSFAGGSNVARLVLNYRSQWPGISGTFRTFSASYDEHFDALHGGVGVSVMTDEAGVGTLRSTTISGIYAYQINLSKYVTMRLGVQGSVVQKSIDFSKLTFYDQIVRSRGFVNPTLEVPQETVFYPNFAAGAVVYSARFYAGFAAHNITEPKQGFYQTTESNVPRRYTVHGGLVIPVVESRDAKRASNIYPNILFMQQREFNQLNLGLYYNQGPLVMGGYFRQNSVNSDAFIFLLGVRTPKIKVGFSYDATISSAKNGARQSYEVSLSIELRKRNPRKTVRNIRCPEF